MTKTAKHKTMRFDVASIDYPPEVIAKWNGEIVKTPDGKTALRWPVVYVEAVKDIPLDCPSPIGVPITILDKVKFGPDSDVEIVGLIDGDGFVDGKNVYKRIIIRNRTLRAKLLAKGGGK